MWRILLKPKKPKPVKEPDSPSESILKAEHTSEKKEPSKNTSTIWKENTKSIRNLTSFWLFGLSNNFGYVIMLSAAYDLLKETEEMGKEESEKHFKRNCNEISTGVILLASIIPSFLAKIVAPFVPLFIHFRMALVVLLSVLGLLLVGIAPKRYVIIMGVSFVSFSSGLGESSLIAYTVFFKTRNVISTWSSGTGAAGLVGAFAYSGLMQLGVTPSVAILSMICMPLIMALCFWIILDRPTIEHYGRISMEIDSSERKLTLKEKFHLIPSILWIYTLPYGLVYFFEYFINQGLFELMQFPKTFLTEEQQYRWYNCIYQAGVFISRSSMNIVHIKKIWLLAFFQCLNVVIFLNEVLFGYMHYLAVPLVLILWEGLLGGAAYVNTFRRIATERPQIEKVFSMSLNSIGDSIMITLAGFVALPVHNAICYMDPPYK